MNKTEQKLLTRSRLHGCVAVSGKREVDAARRLVAQGLAKSFQDLSGLSRGEYYIHPFTRKAGISKSVFVYAGELQLD